MLRIDIMADISEHAQEGECEHVGEPMPDIAGTGVSTFLAPREPRTATGRAKAVARYCLRSSRRPSYR